MAEPKTTRASAKLKTKAKSKGQIRMIQVVITVSALVMGAGGGWMWWVGPRADKIESIAALQERTNKLRTANEKTRKALVELGPTGIQEALSVYLKQETFLRGMIPPEDTTSQLMSRLTTATRKHSVSISEFSRIPRKEIAGFSGTGFGLRLTGRYHAIGAVITELLAAERIVHISDASIKTVSPESFKSKSMSARDLQSLNFGGQGSNNQDVEAKFELYELGISKLPTKLELQERADSTARAKKAQAARKAGEKKLKASTEPAKQ